MSEEKTSKETLTDEDMVTSPKLSRRMLIAGAGAALVAGVLGAAPAVAGEGDAGSGDMETDDAEKDDAAKDDAAKDDMEKDGEAEDDAAESEGDSD